MTGAFSVFAQLNPALWLVTAAAEGTRGGLIASFVHPASITPDQPRVVVGIARNHHTRAVIEAGGRFVLHLLGADHLDWVWTFGLRSGYDTDKFQSVPLVTAPSGQPRVPGALAWLDCRVEASLPTGDRTIYLSEVTAAELVSGEPPLTLRQMVERAPPEKLQELKVQMNRDIQIDAAAILDWRRSR